MHNESHGIKEKGTERIYKKQCQKHSKFAQNHKFTHPRSLTNTKQNKIKEIHTVTLSSNAERQKDS